jgi:hypothetical protein
LSETLDQRDAFAVNLDGAKLNFIILIAVKAILATVHFGNFAVLKRKNIFHPSIPKKEIKTVISDARGTVTLSSSENLSVKSLLKMIWLIEERSLISTFSFDSRWMLAVEPLNLLSFLTTRMVC